MSRELYKKHRPATLKGVVGHESIIASIERMVEKKGVPHALLFSGPSGCGKTTLGRILKNLLECGDSDYFEVNAADEKGIDMIRNLRRHVTLSPMAGACRIWMIDEAHKLTGDAQNALLKILEDCPGHVYFFLATTDPQKLLRTIHTRCSEIKLKSVPAPALTKLVNRVLSKEERIVHEDVIAEIVEAADGSARKALVILEQVWDLDSPDQMIAAIKCTTFDKDQAIDLARLLLFSPKDWNSCAKILRGLKEQDPEGIRYCVLGYARSILVGSEDKGPNLKNGPQAFKVIDIFSRNFYDSKQAGLAAACWEVCHN